MELVSMQTPNHEDCCTIGIQALRPRMEKSHSKRHELSFNGLVSILIVLIAP